jgi:hypothetical protein
MSNLLQFGSGIKSVQRGVISLTNGSESSDTSTLSPAVDPAKTELRFLGMRATGSEEFPYVVLSNSTTVTATRSSTTGTVNVSWEVTEHY